MYPVMKHEVRLNGAFFYRSEDADQADKMYEIVKNMTDDPRHHYHNQKVQLYDGDRLLKEYLPLDN